MDVEQAMSTLTRQPQPADEGLAVVGLGEELPAG